MQTVQPGKPFSLDRIEKQFGQVTKHIGRLFNEA